MQLKTIFTSIIISVSAFCYAQQTDTTAEKMLIYQLDNGGWPKQLENKSVVNYAAPLTETLMSQIKETTVQHATIDNKATSREINYLIAAYKKTNHTAYLKAAEKGIGYILSAQYANGGWPQYYPNKALYRSEITYNDNAMVNVLNILQDIVNGDNGFDQVAPSYLPKAKKGVEKGLACILKTQVLQNGKLAIWAAQYDKDTLRPAKARAFEPASLSTSESVGIVRFLMRFKNPSAEIKTAIISAKNWFEANQITGYKFGGVVDSNTNIKNMALIKDSNGVAWARFYDLTTNKPIFGDRDNTVKYKLEDLSNERRNGYAWYGNFAQQLLEKEYPKWLSANGIKTI